MDQPVKNIIVGKYRYTFSMPNFQDARLIFVSGMKDMDKLGEIANKYIYVAPKDAKDEDGRPLSEVFYETKDAIRSLSAVTTWFKWVAVMQSNAEDEMDEWTDALGEF